MGLEMKKYHEVQQLASIRDGKMAAMADSPFIYFLYVFSYTGFMETEEQTCSWRGRQHVDDEEDKSATKFSSTNSS